MVQSDIKIKKKTHRKVHLHQREVEKANEDPDDQREEGYANNEGYKIAADLICILLDGSLKMKRQELNT